jgi:hypothetical protein
MSSSPTVHASTSTSDRTPSTRRPSATPCARSSPTTARGSGSSRQLAADAQERLAADDVRGDIFVFKNNTDSAGNSYGCHENFLVRRTGDFGTISEGLLPFLISRQLICGAGKIVRTSAGAPPSP